MPSRSEIRADDAVYFDEALRVRGGLKPSHVPLAFTGGLMRVLRPIVKVPVLALDHGGHHDSSRGGVTLKFVRDHHPWSASGYTQYVAKELCSREAVPLRLDQNINDHTILIHRARGSVEHR